MDFILKNNYEVMTKVKEKKLKWHMTCTFSLTINFNPID
jgi:hypothetical protein